MLHSPASIADGSSQKASLRRGDEIEVFYQMPFPEDHGNERVDVVGDRWILSAHASLGTNRPRVGWTQRWLPAVVTDVMGREKIEAVGFQWEPMQWYDWATGEHISITKDPKALASEISIQSVRARTAHAWNIPKKPLWNTVLYPRSSEAIMGGCDVEVSFIVFQWGAAKIPIEYDSHSWGEEGSTISNRFIRTFFKDAVIPRLSYDYEVLTVFIQHSDEFPGVSPEFFSSICRGKVLCALYFVWPIQGLQSYGS